MPKPNPRLLISRTTDEASNKNFAGGFENCRDEPPSWMPQLNTLVQEFNNFKSSRTPARFLFLRDGSWVDFPPQVFDILRDAFVTGNLAFEVPIGGSSHFFDFLRMTQVDLDAGALNPIAWIDVDGRCFFPQMGNWACPEMEIKVRIHRSLSSSEREDSSSIHQEHSDESPAVSSTDQPRWLGTELLKEEDRLHKVVANLFLAQMRKLDPGISITFIHRCSLRNSRLKAFQMQVQMTKAARGSENLKFCWYSTSSNDLPAIISHGFGKTNSGLLGSGAHGVGIHLSPPHSPYSSSVLLEADGNGERHIVLCRAIMGRMEKVEAGSLQYHPSSEEFDSGADDLANPRWCVVWSTHMNTHIIPEYVVSYKSLKQPQGPTRMISSTKGLPVSSMSFSKLFAEIVRSLPSSMTRALEIMYQHYRGGKISKESFIRYLRTTVGDKILTTTIRRIRGY